MTIADEMEAMLELVGEPMHASELVPYTSSVSQTPELTLNCIAHIDPRFTTSTDGEDRGYFGLWKWA